MSTNRFIVKFHNDTDTEVMEVVVDEKPISAPKAPAEIKEEKKPIPEAKPTKDRSMLTIEEVFQINRERRKQQDRPLPKPKKFQFSADHISKSNRTKNRR